MPSTPIPAAEYRELVEMRQGAGWCIACSQDRHGFCRGSACRCWIEGIRTAPPLLAETARTTAILEASTPPTRTFPTGANRNGEDGKYDYEAFLSPLVLQRYAAYMHRNRELADGTLRAGDNWQKGFPRDVLMKSAWRHFVDWWTLHDGYPATRPEGGEVDAEEALCGLLFNAMAYLHEVLLGREEMG